MAKVSAIDKNKKRGETVARFADRRAKLKAVVMNRKLPLEARFEASVKLAALPRDGARVRVRNRCRVTGRPRGYYRSLGISRIALRDLASIGQVPGVVKSSW